MYKNLAAITDSYKFSHYLQYPPGTTHVTSYIESRGYDDVLFPSAPEVVLFGLDFFIRDYLKPREAYSPDGESWTEGLVYKHDVDRAERLARAHGEPFNRAGWDRIVKVHGGVLPIRIEALPEGTVVPSGIPLAQVVNLDPELPWLTSFIETPLLRAMWYPSTVATVSREAKKIIKGYLDRTGDPSLLPFKLHDFGARGVSSHESARLGGAAHLVNFMGTDTFEAIDYLDEVYGLVAGFSIPASEHSTITSWGREREHLAFKNMLNRFGGGIVACVSDSYDLYGAVRDIWGGELRDQVLDMEGSLVVRPDSGDPRAVTLKVAEILWEKFGGELNSKGYRVLNPKVRIIQGDGVNLRSIEDILSNLAAHGFSADNIAFGMGGGLLQSVNRDSLKFAMKACEVRVDGVDVPIFKDPSLDPGKASKKGRQGVYRDPDLDWWRACPVAEALPGMKNLLEARYSGSEEFVQDGFAEIRRRAEVN